MDQGGGYVRLYRKLLENPIWTQLVPAVAKVAILFLLKANYRPSQWYDGVTTVDIPAGAFVTSYASIAAACNISVQQTRDAFEHLSRTHFATYRRTRRWTLVTVLNWGAYQASSDEREHTGEHEVAQFQEHAGEQARNRQGTTVKELRIKKEPICASDDARVGELSSIDNPPFDTTEPDALFPMPASRNATTRPALSPQQAKWFAVWWDEYPLHKARKTAEQAFAKHVRTAARFEQVMAATRSQISEMMQREPSKRPYGATWLNGARWEDELNVQPGPKPVKYFDPRTITEACDGSH